MPPETWTYRCHQAYWQRLLAAWNFVSWKRWRGGEGTEREDTCARAVLRPLQQPLALQQMPGTYYRWSVYIHTKLSGRLFWFRKGIRYHLKVYNPLGLGWVGNLRKDVELPIKDFLYNRSFRVHLSSTLLKSFTREIRVPQGCILSTTLFVGKMNSISVPKPITYSLYVDDLQTASASFNTSTCEKQLMSTKANN